MDFAMKEVNARDIEIHGERSPLRLVLIHHHVGSGWLHEKRDRMLRAGAAVVDFKIDPLTWFNDRKWRPGVFTLKPVTGFIGEIHCVDRSSICKRGTRSARCDREKHQRNRQRYR